MLDTSNRSSSALPSACVFGAGEYYRKIKTGLRTQFRILQEFNESGPAVTHQVELLRPDAILILSPSATHYEVLASIIHLKVPVLVEKPAVVSRHELDLLDSLLRANPRVYFSDNYVDVRALPLLAFFNRVPSYHDHMTSALVVSGDEAFPTCEPETLRSVRQITGTILEGEGPASRMEHRPWLLDPSGGGVMLDLLPHLVAILARLFPSDPIRIEQATAGRHEVENEGTSKWHLLESFGSSVEAYCEVSGSVGANPHFEFQAAKYWNTTQRRFVLTGDEATFSMEFSRINELQWRVSGRQGCVTLSENYHDLTAQGFRQYVEAGIATPHNYEETRNVLATILNCKRNYPDLPHRQIP